MFDAIAPAYDVLNRVITFNLDLLWDARVAQLTPPGARTLDFGCGTGDLLERLLARTPAAKLVGLDLSGPMLRAARTRLAAPVGLVQGDGERLPFRDGAFEAVVSAFVMRNVGDRRRAYREIARVLRAGAPSSNSNLRAPGTGASARCSSSTSSA